MTFKILMTSEKTKLRKLARIEGKNELYSIIDDLISPFVKCTVSMEKPILELEDEISLV